MNLLRTIPLLLAIACLSFFSVSAQVVSNLNDDGPGSLRDAIQNGGGNITFSVTGTINLTTDHLFINRGNFSINGGGNIVIDASGLPDERHVFFINNGQSNITIQGMEIRGATPPTGILCGDEVSAGGIGVYLRPDATNITIRDCYIHSNASHGIFLEQRNHDVIIRDNIISNNCNNGIQVDGGSLRCRIFGNLVGTDVAGTAAFGNYWDGIVIDNRSHDFIIGGAAAAERNVVSGNGQNVASLAEPTDRGIRINNSEDGIVRNNYVGTDITGTIAIGNGRHGVFLHSVWDDDPNLGAQRTLIENNVISANGTLPVGEGHGINIADERTTNNIVRNNIIGLDVTGQNNLGNKNDGVSIFFASNNMIGGANIADRNIISGNNFGVFIQCYSDNNIVQNNYIGTNIDGTVAVPNDESGVIIQGGYYSWINWTDPDGPSTNNEVINNLISGNALHGVIIQNGEFPDGPSVNPTTDNVVQGNVIGLMSDGVTPLPNGRSGARITDRAAGNSIGGTALLERNVIAGNDENGIELSAGATNNTVENNFIGVDINEEAVPNGLDGILIDSADANIIGGDGGGTGNVIAGNTNNGINIINGSDNIIKRNFIGNNLGETATNLGNGLNGIMISTQNGGDATGNRIGDENDWARRNIISYNGENGILILDGDARLNPIRKNSIYCNSVRGIELNSAGNDNYSTPPGQPIVNDDLDNISGNVAPNAIVEVFTHDPGCVDCQGKIFVDQTTADGAGDWSLNTPIADPEALVITATEPGGGARNTSEFSLCSTLPVELIAFTAEATAENTIRLLWTTASEINNDRFIIERSADGSSFEAIGEVAGNGNTNTLINYTFTDQEPLSGINYYRLRQIDYDGTEHLSKVISIALDQQVVAIYPNPGNGHYTVSIQQPGNGDIRLTLITPTGQTAHQKTMQGPESTLDITHLPAGIYYLRIQTGSGLTVKKVVKE